MCAVPEEKRKLCYGVETALDGIGLTNMADQQKKPTNDQRDANLAADTRPVPSKAEGDVETVDEDLAQKQNQQSGSATAGGRK